MSRPSLRKNWFMFGAFASVILFALACPTWRTEHKVETTHKIEAHIVLDIRKVRDEAEQIESEVRQTPGSESVGKPSTMHRRSFWSIFDLSSSAHAQASPGESDAIARRKQRFPQIDKDLTQGCLGENNKGMLESRPCEAASNADEKKRLDELIAAENADRKIIYSATALRSGGSAEHFEQVGEVYAGEIAKKLKKGQAFQVPSSDKLFNEFLASPLGKALGSPKKGDWVKVP